MTFLIIQPGLAIKQIVYLQARERVIRVEKLGDFISLPNLFIHVFNFQWHHEVCSIDPSLPVRRSGPD